MYMSFQKKKPWDIKITDSLGIAVLNQSNRGKIFIQHISFKDTSLIIDHDFEVVLKPEVIKLQEVFVSPLDPDRIIDSVFYHWKINHSASYFNLMVESELSVFDTLNKVGHTYLDMTVSKEKGKNNYRIDSIYTEQVKEFDLSRLHSYFFILEIVSEISKSARILHKRIPSEKKYIEKLKKNGNVEVTLLPNYENNTTFHQIIFRPKKGHDTDMYGGYYLKISAEDFSISEIKRQYSINSKFGSLTIKFHKTNNSYFPKILFFDGVVEGSNNNEKLNFTITQRFESDEFQQLNKKDRNIFKNWIFNYKDIEYLYKEYVEKK